MPRLSPGVSRVFGYWWQLISDFANNGFTVTETVQAANEIARDAGTSLSFSDNNAISQLFGMARGIVNAGDTFQAASPEQFISSEMIALAPYARDEAEMTTFPTYHVKFEYTYLDAAGVQQTAYKTSVFEGQLPGTVGELTSDVLDDAEAMAAKYNHTLLSVIPLQILAV